MICSLCYCVIMFLFAVLLQTKSCSTSRRPRPFIRGVRRNCAYSRARCSYRRAVDASSLSFSTPPDKSLSASSYMDSLPESKTIVVQSCSLNVCLYIHPQNSSSDSNEIWYNVGRGRWVMHYIMWYDSIRASEVRVKVTRAWKFKILRFLTIEYEESTVSPTWG